MSNEDWERKYDAPECQTWVCGACGRHHTNRVHVGDESCFLNAVLCYDSQPWKAVPGVDKWGQKVEVEIIQSSERAA